jgi:uncharacterized caspase-like protein
MQLAFLRYFLISAALLCMLPLVHGCQTTGRGKLAPSPGEPVADFPQMTVGDSFTMRLDIYQAGFGTFHWKVIEVLEDGSFIMESTREGSNRKNKLYVHKEQPDSPSYIIKNEKGRRLVFANIQFPLFVGKKWSEDFRGLSQKGKHILNITANYHVDKYELIQTRAGPLMAFRIKGNASFMHPKKGFKRRMFKYWYSPSAKMVMKADYSNRFEDIDLLSYNVSTAEPSPFTPPPVEAEPVPETAKAPAPEAPEPEKKVEARVEEDVSPPEIKITSHNTRALKIKLEEKKTTIQGTAKDPSGIVEVLVNRKDAKLDAEGNFQADVYLIVGENEITVTAMDAHENRATKTLTIVREGAEIDMSSGPEEKFRGWYTKQYAIVIGIDQYQSAGIDPLQNAVNDARAISAMFRKMGFEVIEFYNSQATRKNILSSLRKVTGDVQSNDSFVFYFAGHGQGLVLANNEKVGYIIPYDADIALTDTDAILYNLETIPLNDLKIYSKDMESKHVALLLDSCFSGLAMKRSLPKLDKGNLKYYNNILNRKAINILTAGDDQPISDGSGHSPFTQAILFALDRGNIDLQDQDGLATFTELAAYVKHKVEKATGRRQRPQFDNLSLDDGDFLFLIVK